MQGTLKAPIKAIFLRIFLDFSGPYGPIGAHMGPYGPIWAHMGLYGPIWALMGPYGSENKKKIHLFELLTLFKGPGRAHMGPYGPENSKKIRKEIAFIGAFKVPCTLP